MRGAAREVPSIPIFRGPSTPRKSRVEAGGIGARVVELVEVLYLGAKGILIKIAGLAPGT